MKILLLGLFKYWCAWDFNSLFFVMPYIFFPAHLCHMMLTFLMLAFHPLLSCLQSPVPFYWPIGLSPSTFLSHLYSCLFTVCPLTLFPITAQCLLFLISPDLATLFLLPGWSYFDLRVQKFFLSPVCVPADHICGRAEGVQAFLVAADLHSLAALCPDPVTYSPWNGI